MFIPPKFRLMVCPKGAPHLSFYFCEEAAATLAWRLLHCEEGLTTTVSFAHMVGKTSIVLGDVSSVHLSDLEAERPLVAWQTTKPMPQASPGSGAVN